MRLAVLFLTTLAAFCAAPPKAAVPDATIEANIRAKFAKSKIAEEQFKVTVKSGVALIEGKTEVPQRKGVATRFAKTGGARQVVNNIQISEAARKKLSDRLQKAREARAAAPKRVAAKAAAPSVPAANPPAKNSGAAKPVTPAAGTPGPPVLRRMEVKR